MSLLLLLVVIWSAPGRFLVGGLRFLGGATLPFVGVEITSVLASWSKDIGFSSASGWMAILSKDLGT